MLENVHVLRACVSRGGHSSVHVGLIAGNPTWLWEVKAFVFVFLPFPPFNVVVPSMLKHAILSGENRNFTMLFWKFEV